MSLTRADVFNQFLRHRHLQLRVFAQRHANGVAHTLGKQRANAHSALYSAVLAVASLGDAQVQRKVHIFGIHSHNQSPNRFHHHHRVRSLDGNHHVGETLSHKHTQELHHALHHSGRRVAVTAHDAVAERAVIHAKAHRRAMFAAQSNERHQGVANLRQFGNVFLVGEREFLERASYIDKITRIDTHLVGSDSRSKGSARIEMNVSHQRQLVALGDELTANHTNVIGLTHTLSGEAHKVGTGIGNAAALSHAALGVHGAGGGHRLHTHRIVGAHHQVLDAHRCGFATFIVNHSSPRLSIIINYFKKTHQSGDALKRRFTATTNNVCPGAINWS